MSNEFEQAKLLYQNAVQNIDRIKDNEFKLIASVTAITGFMITTESVKNVEHIKCLYTFGIFCSGILLIIYKLNVKKHRARLDNIYGTEFRYLGWLRKNTNNEPASDFDCGDYIILIFQGLYLIALTFIFWNI